MPVPPAGADASARAAAGVFRSLREPPLDDRFERRGVDVVELVPALAAGLDQARGLQNVEVLRDRLPRRAKPVLDRQARADLKERLPVPVGQLVEDRAARGIGQGLEDVTHTRTLCKQILACQHRITPGPVEVVDHIHPGAGRILRPRRVASSTGTARAALYAAA